MKPSIIALKGKGNCGKSKTLIRVLSMLENQPGGKVIEKEKIGDSDMSAIILVGGTKIGITTAGDPGDYLEIKIEVFIKVECQIIICACRTRQSTRDVIRKYETSHNVHLISQDYDDLSEAGQLRIQEMKAAEILDLTLKNIQTNQSQNTLTNP